MTRQRDKLVTLIAIQSHDRRDNAVFKDIAAKVEEPGTEIISTIMRSPSDDEIGGKILENCIEKNFHVLSHMKAVRNGTFPFHCGCNFKRI